MLSDPLKLSASDTDGPRNNDVNREEEEYVDILPFWSVAKRSPMPGFLLLRLLRYPYYPFAHCLLPFSPSSCPSPSFSSFPFIIIKSIQKSVVFALNYQTVITYPTFHWLLFLSKMRQPLVVYISGLFLKAFLFHRLPRSNESYSVYISAILKK